VYVGAIAILFLFVIMLVDVSSETTTAEVFTGTRLLLPLALFIAGAAGTSKIVNYLVVTFYYPSWSVDMVTLTDIQSLGYVLYLAYPLAIVL
jgi:NADH:ubiquinone oxidoreductase subunit 6 (subunit J)